MGDVNLIWVFSRQLDEAILVWRICYLTIMSLSFILKAFFIILLFWRVSWMISVISWNLAAFIYWENTRGFSTYGSRLIWSQQAQQAVVGKDWRPAARIAPCGWWGHDGFWTRCFCQAQAQPGHCVDRRPTGTRTLHMPTILGCLRPFEHSKVLFVSCALWGWCGYHECHPRTVSWMVMFNSFLILGWFLRIILGLENASQLCLTSVVSIFAGGALGSADSEHGYELQKGVLGYDKKASRGAGLYIYNRFDGGGGFNCRPESSAIAWCRQVLWQLTFLTKSIR